MSEEIENQGDVPETEASSEPPSIPELDTFIFEHDEYRAEVVPRKLVPAEVAKYLIGRIKKDEKLEIFVQVEKVAEFYDTNEVVDKYREFLDKGEADSEEIQRSIVIARIIGRLGQEKDLDFARKYYTYLLGRAESIQEFQDLISLHEALRMGVNSGDFKTRINSLLESLEDKKDSDYQAKLQYLELKGTISNKLFRAVKVEELKSNILDMSDRKARIREEIKAYLAIKYGLIEYLQPWAARRLRMETWADTPSKQAIRNDEQPSKDTVAAGFREFMSDLDTLSLREKEKESAKIRILRAINFFGGKVSEEEDAFLQSFKGIQIDILANEGFQIDGEER